LVQFRPGADSVDALRSAAADSVGRALGGEDAARDEVAALDDHFGGGTYLAWGADRAPIGHTASVMAYPNRPASPAPPALDDAADAELSGNLAALAPASGALAFDLVPEHGQ